MISHRYLHVKENFNKQVDRVREGLVKNNKQDEEDYDSSVYKDEDEDNEEDHEEGKWRFYVQDTNLKLTLVFQVRNYVCCRIRLTFHDFHVRSDYYLCTSLKKN